MPVSVQILASAISDISTAENEIEVFNVEYNETIKTIPYGIDGLHRTVKIHGNLSIKARATRDMISTTMKILDQAIEEEKGKYLQFIKFYRDKADVLSATVVALVHNLRVADGEIASIIGRLKKEPINDRLLRIFHSRKVLDFVSFEQIRDWVKQDHHDIEDVLATWKIIAREGPVLVIRGNTPDQELLKALNFLVASGKIRKKFLQKKYQPVHGF